MPVAPPEERAVIDLIREAEAAGRNEEALSLAEERLEMGRRRLGVKKSSDSGFTSGAKTAILTPVIAEQPTTRRGYSMSTWPTRTQFYPLDPRPEEVHLSDLATHLSHICRYNGAVPELYTVAQHSVLVSLACERAAGCPAGFVGLFHDGAEAYVGDATWPLKQAAYMAEHCAVEGRIQAVIYERFGIDPRPWEALVKHWDAAVLLAETRDLLGGPDWAFDRVGREGMEPFPEYRIEPWAPRRARVEFYLRFQELAG